MRSASFLNQVPTSTTTLTMTAPCDHLLGNCGAQPPSAAGFCFGSSDLCSRPRRCLMLVWNVRSSLCCSLRLHFTSSSSLQLGAWT